MVVAHHHDRLSAHILDEVIPNIGNLVGATDKNPVFHKNGIDFAPVPILGCVAVTGQAGRLEIRFANVDEIHGIEQVILHTSALNL